jgi:hypothetical protein
VTPFGAPGTVTAGTGVLGVVGVNETCAGGVDGGLTSERGVGSGAVVAGGVLVGGVLVAGEVPVAAGTAAVGSGAIVEVDDGTTVVTSEATSGSGGPASA